MDHLAPFTGFGDDTNASIKFTIWAPSGRTANWQGGARLNTFAIPHSNRTITQHSGMNEWTISLPVLVDSVEDLDMLDALQGRRATLRYERVLTKRVGGTIENMQGVSYLTLPDTLLVQLSGESYEPDGPCEAVLTFSRPVEPSSYYGFAVYGEDAP